MDNQVAIPVGKVGDAFFRGGIEVGRGQSHEILEEATRDNNIDSIFIGIIPNDENEGAAVESVAKEGTKACIDVKFTPGVASPPYQVPPGWSCTTPKTTVKAYYAEAAGFVPFTNSHYNSEDKYRYALYKKSNYTKPSTPGKYIIKSNSINTHIGDLVLWFFDSTKVRPNNSRVETIEASKWSRIGFVEGTVLKSGQQVEITSDVLDKNNLDSIAFAHVKKTGDNFKTSDLTKTGHDACIDVEFVANPDGSSDPPGPPTCPNGFVVNRYSEANSTTGKPDTSKQITT